jgi:hypothetical protein
VSYLGQRASELVRAGREAGRATEEDRDRNLAALRARLGAAPVPESIMAAQVSRRASRALWTMAAVMVVVLGAGAALAITMRRPHPALQPVDFKPMARGQVETAPAPPKETPGAALSVPVESLRSVVVGEPGSAVTHRPERDRLAQEVAILSRAASSLEAGRAADALRAVDEHQRKFPNGVLKEERYAARVQALCALGRRDEAASELARLSRLAPDSPQVARARHACAAVPSAAPASSASAR